MGADKVARTADRTLAVDRPLAAAASTQDNRFWFGLAFVAALHAALIFGVTRSSPRQIGERSGRPDGISVVLVDEADLKSKNTFREDGSSDAPPAIAEPPTPAAPQPPQPKASELPVPKQPPAPKVEAAPPAPRPLDEQKDARAIDKESLDLLAPGPAPKQSDPGSAAKIPPKQEQLEQKPPLQLTMPSIPVAPGGRAAAVARPPGATRSGENDEFGRGVIRALRQTMPSPNGQLGRVTVKLLLSNSGNLAEVQLIRSAGVPGLDQSVVFAVKQASFPIPPGGATLVDRTFLVTYIYN